MNAEEKHFSMNGGETRISMVGKWYIVEIIRQIESPFRITHQQTDEDFFNPPWNWNTIIIFDYPFLPREQIMVRANLSQNGVQRAASIIKKDNP